MNEEQILRARIKDLAERSYKQNIYTYTSFLNPAELTVLSDIKEEISFVDYSIFGGYELAERQVVCFGSERSLGYEGIWPIKIIKVEPLIEKFSDELGHRDFLGAIMNLGIERNVFGDILVKDNFKAYIFALDSISGYIMENLTKIKHTNVKCRIVSEDSGDMSDLVPSLVDMNIIVASPRFDAIVGAVTKTSRSEALNMFKAKKITLNGRLCERNSMTLKEEDVFSVRGYGKFKFRKCGNETRKGRINVLLSKYC